MLFTCFFIHVYIFLCFLQIFMLFMFFMFFMIINNCLAHDVLTSRPYAVHTLHYVN